MEEKVKKKESKHQCNKEAMTPSLLMDDVTVFPTSLTQVKVK